MGWDLSRAIPVHRDSVLPGLTQSQLTQISLPWFSMVRPIMAPQLENLPLAPVAKWINDRLSDDVSPIFVTGTDIDLLKQRMPEK